MLQYAGRQTTCSLLLSCSRSPRSSHAGNAKHRSFPAGFLWVRTASYQVGRAVQKMAGPVLWDHLLATPAGKTSTETLAKLRDYSISTSKNRPYEADRSQNLTLLRRMVEDLSAGYGYPQPQGARLLQRMVDELRNAALSLMARSPLGPSPVTRRPKAAGRTRHRQSLSPTTAAYTRGKLLRPAFTHF